MTRSRASVLFAGVAIFDFVIEQLQRLTGIQSEIVSIVPVLLLVIALLTLILSSKTIVVYGSVIVMVLIIVTGIDLLNTSLGGTSKVLSLCGGLSVAGTLVYLLKAVARSTWMQSRRYTPTSDDPWVSLDKGIDPTVESGKEGS